MRVVADHNLRNAASEQIQLYLEKTRENKREKGKKTDLAMDARSIRHVSGAVCKWSHHFGKTHEDLVMIFYHFYNSVF